MMAHADLPYGPMPTPGSSPPARLLTPAGWECSALAATPWSAKRPHVAYQTGRRNSARRSGIGNKGFSREGFVGQFYFGQHVDLQVVTQHGEDNAGSARAMATLDRTVRRHRQQQSAGNDSSRWIASAHLERRPLEPHYVYSPQLIFIGRYETIRMSQQSRLPARLLPTSAISPPTPSAIATTRS